MTPSAILLAGPTASGKSALALALAETLGGTIINADSMQVYRDLRIITARPAPEEEARVPHRLYGHVDAAENYSVGRWCVDAAAAIAEAEQAGAPADRRRRHRPLLQDVDAGAGCHSADPGRASGRRCASVLRATAWRRFTPSLAAAIPPPRNG